MNPKAFRNLTESANQVFLMNEQFPPIPPPPPPAGELQDPRTMGSATRGEETALGVGVELAISFIDNIRQQVIDAGKGAVAGDLNTVIGDILKKAAEVWDVISQEDLAREGKRSEVRGGVARRPWQQLPRVGVEDELPGMGGY